MSLGNVGVRTNQQTNQPAPQQGQQLQVQGVKVRIISIMKMPSMERDRMGKMDYYVRYTINNSPDIQTIRIPEEEFTPENVLEKIKEEVSKIGPLLGKEFVL